MGNNRKIMSKITTLLLAAFVCISLGNCQQPWPKPKECEDVTAVSEQEITDKYFNPFGPWQRPKLNPNEPIRINLTFVLSSINDVLEKERKILLTAYISIRWMDEFRVWKDDFPLNCVDYVVLPATEVWLPDIAQMNAEDRYTLMGKQMEKVRIYNYGYATYSPGGTFMAFYFDLTYFPFDTQRCAVKIESWRYTSNYMTFNLQNNVTIKGWSENEQWSLVSTSQAKIGLSYLDPQNSFDHVEFYVVIRRKIVYYLMNVIIPSSIISLAQLSAFSLPVEEPSKIDISFTCLLAYGVFQLMVIGDIPRTSDHIPLLSIYVSLQMTYIALSMLTESLVFLALKHVEVKKHRKPKEMHWVAYKVICILGVVLFVDKPPQFSKKTAPTRNAASAKIPVLPDAPHRTLTIDHSEPKAEGEENQDRRAEEREIKWLYSADVLDRFAFIFYLCGIVVTPVAMFGIYAHAKPQSIQA